MRRIHLAALAILSVWGCNGNGDPNGLTPKTAPASTTAPVTTSAAPVTSSTAPVTSSTPPAAPKPASSSGGKGGIAGVTQGKAAFGLSFSSDPRSKYSLYVPASAALGKPIGVVLAFHGVEGSSAPDSWFQVCTFFCNQDRFIIVAPYGDVNDGGSGAWTQPFAREILDLVRSKYDVDDKRQYLAAISGGCLPGIWFGLASSPATWTAPYQNTTIKGGYQSEFAAVGFSAPVYVPSMPDFAAMTSKDAAGLGFAPGFWVDYGQLTQEGANATIDEQWAAAHGYQPVRRVERTGEGHAPVQPFSYEKQMFDAFASCSKP